MVNRVKRIREVKEDPNNPAPSSKAFDNLLINVIRAKWVKYSLRNPKW